MKIAILFLFFVCMITNTLWAQTITGIVSEKDGTKMPNVNVTLRSEKSIILTATITDKEGKFSIFMADLQKQGELTIGFMHLGHKKKTIPLVEGQKEYLVEMSPDSLWLDEINIKKSPHIVANGDTLTYNVNSFSRPEDRSIGDVLKRMPGITLADNGKLSYNGKDISNLFVGGDDLMDGKYGLATKAIPKELIANVEVIENHQPIRVLKNKLRTNDIAINLTIKNENELNISGELMAGGGIKNLYDGAAKAIGLSKKIKLLDVGMLNSIGTNYRNDFLQLGKTFSGTALPKANYLLSNATAGSPDLPISRWYDNLSKSISLNNIYNTQQKLQLKGNFQFFSDRNHLNYNSLTSNYTANRIIEFKENQWSKQRAQAINGVFSILKNSDKIFLNSEIKFAYDKINTENILQYPSGQFSQYLDNKSHDISANFSVIPQIRKNILKIEMKAKYGTAPQVLEIDTGINSDVINMGIPYNRLQQYVRAPNFHAELSSSYLLPRNVLTQIYQIGFKFEQLLLQSELDVLQNNSSAINHPETTNDLKWQKKSPYISAGYNFKFKKFEFSLSLPVQLQTFHINQFAFSRNERKNFLIFTPSSTFRWATGAEDNLSGTFSSNTETGSITDVYLGRILTNYRTLQNSAGSLQQKQITSLGSQYSLRRATKMLFVNFGLNYRSVFSNTILSTNIDPNSQNFTLIPLKNRQSSLLFSTGASKYLFEFNGTLSTTISGGLNTGEVLIDGTILEINGKTAQLSLKYDTNIAQLFSVTYEGTVNYNSFNIPSNLMGTLNNEIIRLDNSINLGHALKQNMQVNFSARNIYNKASGGYTFLDLKYTCRLTRPRMDVELVAQNLLNNTTYIMRTLSPNQTFTGSYGLRGINVLARLSFLF